MAEDSVAESAEAEDWINDDAKACAYWLGELDRSEKAFKNWNDRSDKISKRYRDERDRAKEGARRFNILWSNIATLKPAIYSRLPKPVIERRFLERNDAERVAGMALERAVAVELETGGFDDAIGGKQSAVIDYLLCSRGQVWIRYEAEIDEEDETSVEAGDGGDEDGEKIEQSETQLPAVTSERLCVDYVQRQDFRHDPARTWTEVRWTAKRSWLNRDKARKKFGAKADEVSYGTVEAREENQDERDRRPVEKRGEFWELWDKDRRLVWVIAPSCTGVIFKKEPDPLELKEFFPCPRPLYGTMTPDTLVPVPDYLEYQDQAEELDELSERIALVTSAIQVRGFYDASLPEMAQLLQNRAENKLIAIENWAGFVEKGGFEKTISLMPLDMLIQALEALEECFQKKLDRLYEITGIADILRGNSDPDETAKAQQIKGQFATLRLKDRQKDVAVFCRDVIRIMVELIASKFSPQTIAAMTGLGDQSSQDAQYFQQAMQLVGDARLRSFRIDVENQSTVELDANETRAAATEFLAAAGQFINGVMEAAQKSPQIQPLLGQMLLWGVRQFRTGRELESAFEQYVDQVAQQAKQPQQQPPDPKLLEVQMKAQQAQQDNQIKIADMQNQQQMEDKRQQLELVKTHSEAQLDREKTANEAALKEREMHLKMEFEKFKAGLEHERDMIRIRNEKEHMDRQHALAEKTLGHEVTKSTADRDSKEKIEGAKLAHSDAIEDKKIGAQKDIERVKADPGGAVKRETEDRMGPLFEKLVGALTAPRRIVRGKDGRASHTEVAR